MAEKSNTQCTAHILMIRPANFGFNTETADSNAFQQNDQTVDPDVIKRNATLEFDAFADILSAHGIHVHVVEDSLSPVKSDAVFPNNWITFHENGTVITYPMQAAARRLERRDDVIYTLAKSFEVSLRYYLEFSEEAGEFLEGTGSMIFDREEKIVYACLSPRTNESLLHRFCAITGYRPCLFRASDEGGQDIYHTNVMMAMGDHFVVICLDSVKDAAENDYLRRIFKETNKEIIEISLAQMNAFAGNMLQLKNDHGDTYLVMSEQAFKSLSLDQINAIEKFTNILKAPLYTIEKFGGGSARCMMAEIFLPLKQS